MNVRRTVCCFAAIVFLGVSSSQSRDIRRETSAIVCLPDRLEKVHLRSTDRIPDANGETFVERSGGTTHIEVVVDSMKPASLFGGDYNTYVLWVMPPGEPAENAGEFSLDGTRAKLRASTAAATFGLLVTAEPHYLVDKPSAFVVLEKSPESGDSKIRYPVLEGFYNFRRTSLTDVKSARGEVHTEVRQAFTAVRLAQRAGAAALARPELMKAEKNLDRTLELWRQRADRMEITAQARETIRLAVAAQRLAMDRVLQDARVEGEGSGGGKVETEGSGPRGVK